MAQRNWFFPPRADRYAVKEYCAPVISRWFHTWVGKLYCKSTGEIVEERCISIKLPVYGLYYAMNTDEERWGQLTFQYRGVRGCFFGPVFPPEPSTVDHRNFHG